MGTPPLRVTRRHFLALTAGGVQVLTLRRLLPSDWLSRAVVAGAVTSTPADFVQTVVRPTDQLNVRFEFVHLARSGDTLVAGTPGDPFIRVVFGSQHTTEELVSGTPSGAGVGHRSAGSSRIVVAVDPGSLPLPYTTSTLLDLAEFALAVDPRTADGVGGGPGAGLPDDDVTALELPEGLVVSPNAAGRFTADTAPVTVNDVTEVWRARLGAVGVDGVEEPPEGAPLLRALAETSGADPFDRALIKDVRDELVTATTDYGNPSYPGNEALSVSRLWLTSAGGFLDVSGEWAEGSPEGLLISLLARATTGRDIEVRVAQRGYLAPFGHPATIISVSERQWLVDADGDVTPVLVEQDYLTLRSATATFNEVFFQRDGRLWPFASATVTNAIDEVPVSKQTIPGVPNTQAWVVIDDTTGDPLEIDCVLTDRLGNELDIGPLGVVFASNEHAQDLGAAGPLDEIIDFYQDNANLEPFKKASADGAAIAFAGTTDDERRLTEVECTEITLTLQKPAADVTESELEAAGVPAFLPRLTGFKIRPEELSTTGTGLPPATDASYSPEWRDHGFGASNEGLTYIDMDVPFDVSFDSEGRGLAKPALTVDTLSLALGAGFEPPPPNTTWDPKDVIPDGASLLGVIDLRDIVALVNVGSDVASTEGIPHVETILEPNTGIPDRARLIFDWTSPLKTSGVFVAAQDLDAEGLPELVEPPTELTMHVEQVIPFDGGDPSTQIDLSVTAFALRLPVDPVVIVYFKSVDVNVPEDGPLSFDPEVTAVRFDGTLAFLDPLQQFLEDLLGFTIEVDPDAIVGSLGITLPDLAFGIVNVRNARVGLELDLPLDGDVPTVNLDLGTRENPVSVTVLGIGGSASFGVGVAAREDPFEFLELWMGVVLEAEANFVIGSAGVRLDIGAGLEIKSGGTVVILTGYVSLKGAVEILGFTVLSVGVEASLVYNVQPRILTGTLEIVIGALFGAELSASVQATVDLGEAGNNFASRAFGSRALGTADGGNASFGDRHTKDTWSNYCDAFA